MAKYASFAGSGAADGSSAANEWSWTQLIGAGTVAAGDLVYYRTGGSRTTNTDTFATAGTTALPITIEAYNSTPGDLNTGVWNEGTGLLDTTNFPTILYTTGRFVNATGVIWKNIKIETAAANPSFTGATLGHCFQCYFKQTHANSGAATAYTDAGNYNKLTRCVFDINTNNAAAVACNIDRGYLDNCTFIGNSNTNFLLSMGLAVSALRCRFRDAPIAIKGTSSLNVAKHCSFQNITGDHGLNSGGGVHAEECAAWGATGSRWYDSATSVRRHTQRNNAVGNMTNADVNEGAWPVDGEIALTANPFKSSTDFTPNDAAGGGRLLVNAASAANLDIGAVQAPRIFRHVGTNGGMNG